MADDDPQVARAEPLIVDTHLHIIDRKALRYPWLAGEAALNRDFAYEKYAFEAARLGITRTLHMEVDVDPAGMQAETDYARGIAARPRSLVAGAIAACRPESPDFAAYLEKQAADPFVKGFRRVLHGVPADVSAAPLFHENIRRMQGTGLTYDLIFRPEDLPHAIALADAAPDLTFILDHFGRPDLKAGREQPWWGHVAELARRPNVFAKISGIIAYTDPDGWTVGSLRPFFEHVVRHFGWDRVVWGSDWPVCTLGGGLSWWVAATHALVEGSSLDERGKLFSRNARAIWNLA